MKHDHSRLWKIIRNDIRKSAGCDPEIDHNVSRQVLRTLLVIAMMVARAQRDFDAGKNISPANRRAL
jgi:hypothetical protein